MLVSSQEGHRIWSATYDDDPNPLLALNMRILGEKLGSLKALRIVDVACGTGTWLQTARAEGADVVGVDSSIEMLAKKATGRVVVGDALQLPLADQSADLVVCSLAINYFSSIESAVAEMTRIVRRGGRVVISDLHPEASRAGWKRSFRSGDLSYEMEHHTHDLRDLLAPGLHLAWQHEAHFGDAEQPIFERAGKQADIAIPALHVACWTRV